jgi:hypothetical protein
MLRKAGLLGLAILGLFGFSIRQSTASTQPPTEISAEEARIAGRIEQARSMLTERIGSQDEAAEKTRKVAQWFNWGNWFNGWRNW